MSWLFLLVLLLIASGWPAIVFPQPRPQVLPLHTAEAGASANGATVPALGYEAVAVQNTIAAAWDGTLTYEVTTNNADWTAVNCRNALSTATASTTVAAAGYVVCPVTGAQGFRARVSGRTVGTVTAVAAFIPMSGSGVAVAVSVAPPVGAAATQVQGTANDGAAEVGNPVQVGGVDGGGLMQAFLVGTDGRQDVNVGQINGVTPLMGGGVTGTGSPRVSLATDANTIQISQTTPATTNGVTPVPTSNAAAANALTSSGAVQASNVLKASAGNLYSLTITTGATAGYLMVFNATSAPIDGAVTPAYCSQAPANMTSALEWSIPVRFATGITAVFSTTGCFTKTESATAAFFAQVN